MCHDGRSQGFDGGEKNLTLTLGALHQLSAYLSLSVSYPSSSSFRRHLPPPPSPASVNSRRVRNGAGIHLGGGRERKLPLTALIAFAHTRGGEKSSRPLPPPSMPLNAAFCFFNVHKPSFIFVPCIMAQRWYHQRGASLTKWERQIDCSIRRQGLLSGDLMGSH